MSLDSSRVTITEGGPARLGRPDILVVGIPEIGLVGTIAATYLVQQLGLEELGFIDSDRMPQVLPVHGTEPKYPIRIYGNGKLCIVISETPLPPRLGYDVTKELVDWAKGKGIGVIVGITGLPSELRGQGSDSKPNVFVVTNDKKQLAALKDPAAQPFEEGVMAGAYAMLMKHCMSARQPNVTFLAESHAQFPDPGAAAAVIDVLNRILPIKVDTKELEKEEEEIRVRTRELMSATQSMQEQEQQPSRSRGRGAPTSTGEIMSEDDEFGLEAVERRMNAILEGAVSHMQTSFFDAASASMRPLHKIQLSDKELTVTFDLPYVTKKDVTVTATPDTLTVEAKTRRPLKLNAGGHLQKRFVYERFSRTLSLPVRVNPDKAEARFNRGILVVRFPVSSGGNVVIL